MTMNAAQVLETPVNANKNSRLRDHPRAGDHTKMAATRILGTRLNHLSFMSAEIGHLGLLCREEVWPGLALFCLKLLCRVFFFYREVYLRIVVSWIARPKDPGNEVAHYFLSALG